MSCLNKERFVEQMIEEQGLQITDCRILIEDRGLPVASYVVARGGAAEDDWAWSRAGLWAAAWLKSWAPRAARNLAMTKRMRAGEPKPPSEPKRMRSGPAPASAARMATGGEEVG